MDEFLSLVRKASDDGGRLIRPIGLPISYYSAGIKRRDLDDALSVCHESFVFEDVTLGLQKFGRHAMGRHFQQLFAMMPDYSAIIEDQFQSEGGIAVCGTFRGTMTGSFFDMEPTGCEFEVPFVSLFDLREGLLARERMFYDLKSLCIQADLPIADVSEGASIAKAIGMFEDK